MAKTKVAELKDIDTEYAEAREAFYNGTGVSRKEFREIAERRETAHLLYEFGKGQTAKTMAGLTDEEWEARKQYVRSLEPTAVTTNVNGPDVT